MQNKPKTTPLTRGQNRAVQALKRSKHYPINDQKKNKRNETWDKHTNRRIKTLHPRVQPHAIAFINEVEEVLGIRLRVTQATRSIAEQDALYAQGRTAPGKIVTQAKGGSSYHNYSLAIDVVEIDVTGQPLWHPGDMAFWGAVAEVGKKNGFEWGGNWQNVDLPHFQMPFGLTIQQLKNGTIP